MAPAARVVRVCTDLSALWRALCTAEPAALLESAVGFFTVWGWVYTAVVGPRRALPLLAGVAVAGAYIAHVRPGEIRIPLVSGRVPLRVAAVRPPAVAAVDAVVHQLPLLLAALWVVLDAHGPSSEHKTQHPRTTA